MFRKNKQRSCGVYYPNFYHLHFTTAKAIKSGATCLKPIQNQLINDILTHQKSNGSLDSINEDDRVLATANAMISLALLGPQTAEVTRALEKGINYLLTQKQQQDGMTYWKKGVFFSGGRIFRNRLYFISDEYTTAVVTYALHLYSESLRN